MRASSGKPTARATRSRQKGPDAKAELARLNRTLKTLSAGTRTLLRASDESELLHEMCRVIVKTGGYRLASVAYAEHDEHKLVRWMASIGIALDVLESFHFTWADAELGQGTTATAIRTGQPIVGRNPSTDPCYSGEAYAGVRQSAVELGYAALTAFPLKLGHNVLGALVIGSTDPDAFDEAEVKLLQELADDLAYGISNARTRAQHLAAEATIARLAYFDSVTDLPNRTLMLERLAKAIGNARRRHGTVALLHLEVGRFHEINKVLGYRSGDDLLQELGHFLASITLAGATLGRVGEAEFAILLPRADAAQAVREAQRLSSMLMPPVEVSGLMLNANVGIGIALYPDHAGDAEALFGRARAAMHQAKPGGAYAIYMGGQEQEDKRRLSLMGDLHRAAERGELRLFCQPKIDLVSRKVCGAEALIRWQHPVQGMISPAEFIPLAEQAGMIVSLTGWMLEASFRQSHAWKEAGLRCPLAINLSALDLYDSSLVEHIADLFSRWDIAPKLIQFELTESTLMADPAGAQETLERLKDLGVQLFIDDFGTGHSSLSYLQKLPVDAVKIDQSFVQPMMLSADSAVIVRSTIELGHNLGLNVVAEGVESQAILERLAMLGCDVAQGFTIGRPMPADEFHVWEQNWAPSCDCGAARDRAFRKANLPPMRQ
ncbi:putative bifunctional diguanylate cyclase/phosphodiesterase [Massilia cavernae]|uniref:GGDEF domain-containing protein n=1 Tax=Massilia cavernae TaxID=2320864 RepID=A0A418XGL3_9BURK|nr:GGDEF domain-containing protein [Massilia cavernae]RJG11602.1 GGDEF domain-containing protein [Massilia cavernae]